MMWEAGSVICDQCWVGTKFVCATPTLALSSNCSTYVFNKSQIWYLITFYIASHSFRYQFCILVSQPFWKLLTNSFGNSITPCLKVSTCWIVQNIMLHVHVFNQMRVNWKLFLQECLNSMFSTSVYCQFSCVCQVVKFYNWLMSQLLTFNSTKVMLELWKSELEFAKCPNNSYCSQHCS